MNATRADCLSCSTDIVIFGGGIAGLWLLNHLKNRGFSVILLETSALGAGQSIASQGIIHGGLKYALGGSLSNAAKAIAGMPDRWRACLDGRDIVDLAGCRLLSDHYYMWSEGSYRSRIKTFLGSKSLRGKIQKISDEDFPEPMLPGRGQGSLYKLTDFVVDIPSLLERLAEIGQGRIFKISPGSTGFSQSDNCDGTRLSVNTGKAELTIQAKRVVFAAGEGNADLLKLAALNQPVMQTRPLNMVILRSSSLPRLYLHCIGDDFSLTPRLTVTSHPCENGEVAWYLGGELAEQGVERSDREQIACAGQLARSLFPWVDFSGARWSCLRINRAEGAETGQHRPDSVFVRSTGNFLVVWPTKFTLSPALADEVCATLQNQGIVPGPDSGLESLTQVLDPAPVARPPWQRPDHGA